MNPTVRFFYLLLISTLFSPTLFAQEEDKDDEAPPMLTLTVATSFRLQEDLYYRTAEGEFARLHVGLKSRGTPIKLPLQEEIPLFTLQENEETGATRFQPALTLPIQKDWLAVIVVLLQGNNKVVPYIMEDTLEAHPEDSIRIINLTRMQMGVQVDGKANLVMPWKRSVFPIEIQSGNAIPYTIATRSNAQEEWVRYVKANFRPRGRNLRSNVFLVQTMDEVSGETSLASFAITGQPPESL